MESKRIDLYNCKELKKLKRMLIAMRAAAVFIAAVSLAVCIFFCIGTTTANAQSQLIKTLIASTLGGWAVITLRITAIRHYKYAFVHYEAILNGDEEPFDGSFEVSDVITRIHGGVSFFDVKALGDEQKTLSLYSGCRERFDEHAALRVYCVYMFIKAYEVRYEDN